MQDSRTLHSRPSTTRLITLGTLAGPLPRANRAQSSNVIIVNGVNYVIDAGDGVARRLTEAGINIRDVGLIFITHHHDDHTAGLGTLMSIAWDLNRVAPINVYGPSPTNALVRAARDYFTPNAEIRIADGGRTAPLSSVFFGHDVGAGEIYRDANVKVYAVENTHFAFHSSKHHTSYSYRFETPDKVIVFTGDTGPCDTVNELARSADLLVAEVNSAEERMQQMARDGRWAAMSTEEREGITRQADMGHLRPSDVGRMATNAGVRAVVLTHLTHRASDPSYEDWADQVRKEFAGTVHVAHDLAEFW